jgi:acetyl-CoA carboxylase biotin carboxyl carrier protein
VLSFEQIKELIELVASHGLEGLEVERSGFRLKISGFAGSFEPSESTAVAPEPRVSPPPATREPRAAPSPGEVLAGAEEEPAAEDLHVVASPIVGTFYVAPSPDAEPFVRVGDRVRKGQVLCIIEAMKLMNEIESEVDGQIVKAYPKNAQAVEYGEALFAIQLD